MNEGSKKISESDVSDAQDKVDVKTDLSETEIKKAVTDSTELDTEGVIDLKDKKETSKKTDSTKKTNKSSFYSNIFAFDLKQVADKTNKVSAVKIGDYIRLGYRIIEGDKERIQGFEGLVIAKKGGINNIRSTITVRRTKQGYSVERVFPCFSPRVDSVTVVRSSKVRRAKLFYIRDLKGKKARLKEKL